MSAYGYSYAAGSSKPVIPKPAPNPTVCSAGAVFCPPKGRCIDPTKETCYAVMPPNTVATLRLKQEYAVQEAKADKYKTSATTSWIVMAFMLVGLLLSAIGAGYANKVAGTIAEQDSIRKIDVAYGTAFAVAVITGILFVLATVAGGMYQSASYKADENARRSSSCLPPWAKTRSWCPEPKSCSLCIVTAAKYNECLFLLQTNTIGAGAGINRAPGHW